MDIHSAIQLSSYQQAGRYTHWGDFIYAEWDIMNGCIALYSFRYKDRQNNPSWKGRKRLNYNQRDKNMSFDDWQPLGPRS